MMWISIHESPILSWSLHCHSNTTTTQTILGNYAPMLDQCAWKLYRSTSGGFGRPHNLTHISLSGIWQGPYPTVNNHLSVYQEWGPNIHFAFAVGAGSPQQLQNTITSLYDLLYSHETTPLISTFHVDVDGLIDSPIWASVEFWLKPWQYWEPFPRHSYTKALSRTNAPLTLPYLLAHTAD